MDEEESAEELIEMQSTDTSMVHESDNEYLHWGVTKTVIKDVVNCQNLNFCMLQRAIELKEATDFVFN